MYIEAGEALKNIRVSKNIKRYELSQKSGISEAQITNIEKGKMRPNVVTLKKLSDALECDFEVLYNKFYN